jgi:hypothetical protein
MVKWVGSRRFYGLYLHMGQGVRLQAKSRLRETTAKPTPIRTRTGERSRIKWLPPFSAACGFRGKFTHFKTAH